MSGCGEEERVIGRKGGFYIYTFSGGDCHVYSVSIITAALKEN